MLFLRVAITAGILLSVCLPACGESESEPDEPQGNAGTGGDTGGQGGQLGGDELPQHRDASFCPVKGFSAHCEDPGYYQFETHFGCGLSRYIQLDDSESYEITFTDRATGEVVYRAVRPDVGGGCDVFVDETDGVPVCDDWVLQPCPEDP